MSVGIAKVVEMIARPAQSAHLCFNKDGILEVLAAPLGAPVTAFPLNGMYFRLGETTPGDDSLLRFNSAGIEAEAGSYVLATLRAEAAKAALDSGVAARQNSFLKKYANQTAIIAQMRQNYDPTNPGSKSARLLTLTAIARYQASLLTQAYSSDNRMGVVRTTQTTVATTTSSDGSSSTSTSGSTDGSSNSTSGTSTTTNQSVPPLPAGEVQPLPLANYTEQNEYGISFTWQSFQTLNDPPMSTNITLPAPTLANSTGTITNNGTSTQTSASTATTSSTGQSTQEQVSTATDYAYRVPAKENDATEQRSLISLMDEAFSHYLETQGLPQLETIFTNELAAIDLSIKQLQVAFIDSLLVSPIAGVVTGLFKQPGDFVRAGEPVVRIESTSQLHLVGRLRYSGPVNVGMTATVETSLFGSATSSTLSGTVLAAQGHRNENEWEIVVSVANPSDSVPAHYHFAYDDTTVILS